MSGIPALGTPAPGELRGILGSWLRALSRPIWQASDAAAPASTSPMAQSDGPARVLVVDDNPVNLLTISALLESRGLVPWLAADGAEAVALACELQFDLILMDLQMPILDGLGATSAIRRFETTCSRSAVPVVAYSSTFPGASVLATHGITDILYKPCEAQDLEDCLVKWCPAYRSASTERGLVHGLNEWQVASPSPSSGSASLR